jgi:hypothetical protein
MAMIDSGMRPDPQRDQDDADVTLPDIKMRPKEAQTIGGVLSICDEVARDVFVMLMEKWERAGYVVGTTSQSIVLDAPCGGLTNRIAMLMAGNVSGTASRTATIILFWNNLRDQKQFADAVLDSYQKTVKKIVRLRETESSAHIRVDEFFCMTHARQLLKAMKRLAGSIRPELAEKRPTGKPVTPDNLRGTMKICPSQVQVIFKKLIAGWMIAGGTVQAKQAGRIYLKLKTKPHRSGNDSRLARNFNLLVLAAPKGKQPAYIQAMWNLAHNGSGYLDCIPEVVEQYERTVISLPGVVRCNAYSKVRLNGKFTLNHAETLLKSVVKLKAAEAATA